MNWKNLFSPVKNMQPEEAKRFMNSRQVGDYQLLDVRQPKEYESQHLPDAILIPLAELPQRMDELTREKPVIAYCAIGGRSRGASQLLSANGFSEVYNLAGGIKAWHGQKASGPMHSGLELLHGNEEFANALFLAYAMEEGLQKFYQSLEADAADQDKQLFHQLAGFEQIHMDKLRKAGEEAPSQTGDSPHAGIMEGGLDIDAFLKAAQPHLHGKEAIVDFAMTLETQAFDLYSRLARHSGIPNVQKLFRQLAEEEKSHLVFLAREMDSTIEASL